MSRTHDIVDLVIDQLIDDQRFPLMSRMAWRTKFQSLQQPISDRINEYANERIADALREIDPDP
jgi:hypothetical protein